MGYFGGGGVEQIQRLRRFASRRSKHVFKKKVIEKGDLQPQKMGGLDKRTSSYILNTIKKQSREDRRLRNLKMAWFVSILTLFIIGLITLLPKMDADILWEHTYKDGYGREVKEEYSFRELMIRGYKDYEKGEYDQAMEYFDHAAQLDGTVFRSKYYSALCHYELAIKDKRKIDAAKSKIHQLLTDFPSENNAIRLKSLAEKNLE